MKDIRDEARELAATHGGFWGQHPQWPDSGWRTEVQNGDTRLGYWEWVANQIDAHR